MGFPIICEQSIVIQFIDTLQRLTILDGNITENGISAEPNHPDSSLTDGYAP